MSPDDRDVRFVLSAIAVGIVAMQGLLWWTRPVPAPAPPPSEWIVPTRDFIDHYDAIRLVGPGPWYVPGEARHTCWLHAEGALEVRPAGRKLRVIVRDPSRVRVAWR